MKFDQSEINQNSVSIGKALTKSYRSLCRRRAQTITHGEKGELVVGGIQIMQKYFNRPEN